MSWKAYPLIFHLKSPLHIGWRKVGNLHQTRPYVTGKVVWAALTARLTRQGFQHSQKIESDTEYMRVGTFLNEEFAFSYFFPALEDDIESALFPKLEAGGITYGIDSLPESEFQYLLLDSYASTALDYSRLDKEEGSLHETELIRPRTRPLRGTVISEKMSKNNEFEELGAPVYLVGYLFSQNDINQLSKALNEVQLGAERRYGWGRVQLVTQKLEPTNKLVFHHWQIKNSDPTKPAVTSIADTFLPAHALAADFQNEADNSVHLSVGKTVKGVIEPLVGRETNAANYFGREIAKARICWLPGSNIEKNSTMAIGNYGVWQGLK